MFQSVRADVSIFLPEDSELRVSAEITFFFFLTFAEPVFHFCVTAQSRKISRFHKSKVFSLKTSRLALREESG